MPQLSIPFVLFNRSVVTFAGTGANITGIYMKPLQYRFRRLCKLLHRIHDFELFVQSEVLHQIQISVLVNSGLIPAQINRYAIRLFEVYRFKNPFPRCHGFFAWLHS